MGERTPNLNLYKPSVAPLETGWGEEVNGNFDTIDELLNGAAQSVYLIAGKVNYVANAIYTNGVWNRLNTGVGAVRLVLDPSTQTITVYYAAAGANPISWTTLQTFSSGGLNAGAKKITNLATPTAATDAATKAYIDGLIAALKLSQIAIDADKNWNGKSITNVGAIDTSAGNIGARSQFVDIAAGLTTLRKSQIKTIGCSPGQTVTLMSVIVPSNYSSTIASNCTLHVKAMDSWMADSRGTIKVYCNGVLIGSAPIGNLYDYYKWMSPFNTTGGFKAGDTLDIKLSAGDGSEAGTPASGPPSVAEIRIYSSRATNVAACKVFPEAGTW